MKEPRYWKQLERHPLSAAYPDIKGPAWEAFLANFKEEGIVGHRKITLYEGKVIEGWQLYRACVHFNVKPKFQEVPKGTSPEAFVETMNDHRRHETQEVAMARTAARRERVAAARQEGQSLRTIAEAEGVSEKTVREDLQTLTAGGSAVLPEGGKVTGKDDRQQPATKPPQPKLIPALQALVDGGHITPKLVPGFEGLTKNEQGAAVERINQGMNPLKALAAAAKPSREPGDDGKGRRRSGSTNGEPVWTWKPFEDAFGRLVREIDNLGKPHKANNSPAAEGLRHQLAEFQKSFKEWHKELIAAAKKKAHA